MIGPGVGVWGPNPTALNFSIEQGRLEQSSLPVGKLEAKSPEAKLDWARSGCAGGQKPPLYGLRFAREN